MRVKVIAPFDYAADGFTIVTVQPSEDLQEILDICIPALVREGKIEDPFVVAPSVPLPEPEPTPTPEPEPKKADKKAAAKPVADPAPVETPAAEEPAP